MSLEEAKQYMEQKWFVFKIIRNDGLGYKYGVYNREHEKWAINTLFKGTYEECKIKASEYSIQNKLDYETRTN